MTDQNMRAQKQCGSSCGGGAIAISAKTLAKMLSVSVRQVWRLNAAGKLPQPMRLGGSVRWNRDEVLRWFEAGCPDRQSWQGRKKIQS